MHVVARFGTGLVGGMLEWLGGIGGEFMGVAYLAAGMLRMLPRGARERLMGVCGMAYPVGSNAHVADEVFHFISASFSPQYLYRIC